MDQDWTHLGHCRIRLELHPHRRLNICNVCNARIMKLRRQWLKAAACVLAVLVLLAVYHLGDPAHCAWFPKCPFFVVTGLKCPGCGSQRAIHSLLNGDIAGAWDYNALLVGSIPVLIVLGVATLGRKTWPNFYRWTNSPIFIWTVFAIVISWWVLRNIFNF